MSVLITGIDIPNTMAFRLAFDCGTVFFQPVDKTPRRVYDAKVIQLPAEHGRLIDADALRSRVKTECNQYGAPTIGHEDGAKILDMIDNAPTIIPAEGGGDRAEEV